MWKKGLVISVTLVTLLITGGCAGVDFSVGDSDSSPTSSELYVNVETGKADIILLDSKGQILKYEENSNAVRFANLSDTSYQVMVGKIGYSLFEDKVTVDGEANLEVNLEKADEAPVTAEVSVIDETGEKIDDFTAAAHKNGEEIVDARSEAQIASLPIWPGVIYDYKVTKEEHVAYRKADTVYLETSGTFTLEGSLNPSKQTFAAEETKQLSLGTLADGETAVVAVSSLNFDPQDNTTVYGQVEVDYSSTGSGSSLVKLAGNEDTAANTEVRAVQSRPEVDNQAQQLLDQRMRMLGATAEIEQQVISEAETSLRLNNTAGSEMELGTEKSFHVMDNLQSTSFSQVQATLEKKDDHVYVFVEKEVKIKSIYLEEIKDKFDNQIYEKDLDNFALHEYTQNNLYDIDDNGRPIILITNLEDLSENNEGTIMGAFNPRDYLDKSNSNLADMIYINSAAVKQDAEDRDITNVLGTLAHEFQHLIYFVEKNIAYQEAGQPDKRFTDIWLNEGLSGLAEHLNGYYSYIEGAKIHDPEGKDRGYFDKPSDESLFYWNQKLSDYGASYLFILYLYDQYGAEIIQELNATYQDPRQVIADFTGQDLSSLFLDWALTNQITNKNISDKYSYSISDNVEDVNLTSQPQTENISTTSTDSFSVKPSGVKYYQIEGNGKQVELEINDFDQKTGVVIYRE